MLLFLFHLRDPEPKVWLKRNSCSESLVRTTQMAALPQQDPGEAGVRRKAFVTNEEDQQ